jgi:hypothetical protein
MANNDATPWPYKASMNSTAMVDDYVTATVLQSVHELYNDGRQRHNDHGTAKCP